jgi:hypothetical protein
MSLRSMRWLCRPTSPNWLVAFFLDVMSCRLVRMTASCRVLRHFMYSLISLGACQGERVQAAMVALAFGLIAQLVHADREVQRVTASYAMQGTFSRPRR